MAERVAANGELAVEIVGRGGRGQGLYRAQRIIENRAAQVLELAAMQRGAAGHRVRIPARGSRDGHALAVSAGALREPDRHVQGRIGDFHVSAEQRIPDDRRRDGGAAAGHRQRESAVVICLDRDRLVLNVDQDTTNGPFRPVVDHDARHRD
jgi:hypothetical protein